MIPVDAYTLRMATSADELALLELAALEDQLPIQGPTLIAEVAGIPTAAVSLTDGRGLADPFQDTAELAAILQAHATAPHAVAA